jgi:hypothetical protein
LAFFIHTTQRFEMTVPAGGGLWIDPGVPSSNLDGQVHQFASPFCALGCPAVVRLGGFHLPVLGCDQLRILVTHPDYFLVIMF